MHLLLVVHLDKHAFGQIMALNQDTLHKVLVLGLGYGNG